MAVRVLVVEDENIIAKDIAHTLRRLGYEPLGPVATGEEAILTARTLAPDAALVDILLAGDMDGVDAARLLREEGDIPVVFLTAYSDEGMLERVKPTEPFGYLVKPFEDRELRSTIEIALYAKRLEREKRDAARFSRAALSVVSDAVVVADEKGRTRLLTPAAERLLGVAQAQVLGRPLREVLGLDGEVEGETAEGRSRARASDGTVLTADVRRVGHAAPAGPAEAERAEIVIILRRPPRDDSAPPAPGKMPEDAPEARRAAELAALTDGLARAAALAESLDRTDSIENAARLRAALDEARNRLGRLAVLLG